ncbi:AfsR/SARP family transcriptional regulator [Cryptosporangium aurantiacum]|uniref:Transcriptional regulatory protein, C terminal n=1 Tax=Cryptosporangium aurantiacum TaxID=134849 RepID=A0A1M7RNW5_9ACTN|nr:AfsR/SARP family transcriptional regulator [Cryptosporangium aurantiacum]SHN48003.1 Transcriptional regulatory protein, C terminal [Cryptosporangium aurantiacum]
MPAENQPPANAAPPGTLDFRLLGPLLVIDGQGRQVDIGPRKERAILAMLLITPGQVLPLDRLIDQLWADEPPSSATGTLQAYISQLRRALEPDRAPRTPPRTLLTREPGYLLDIDQAQVDLVRFAQDVDAGRRALAAGDPLTADAHFRASTTHWRGSALQDFSDLPFAQPTITRMHDLHLVAHELQIEAWLGLGRHTEAVLKLEQIVERHRFRERFWALLALGLYRSGRQADALGALQRVRTILADELGLDPGPELRDMEAAVLRQDTSLDLPDTPPGTAVVTEQSPFLYLAPAAPPTDPSPAATSYPAPPSPLAGPPRPAVTPPTVTPATVTPTTVTPTTSGPTTSGPTTSGPTTSGPTAGAPTGGSGPGAAGLPMAPAQPHPSRTPVTEPPHYQAPALPGAGALPLIARDFQLGWITTRLQELPRGRGGVVLLTGEAGIGKTRLAQAATDTATGLGIPIAWGRCVESSASPAFWPWLQVLEACATRPGSAAEDALRLLTGRADSAADPDPDAARFALHAGVASALLAGDSPLLIVIEDLHWADASSLELLAFVAGELHRYPTLILVTLRQEPGEHAAALHHTLGDVARQPGVERVNVHPFTAEDVAEFLNAHQVEPAPRLVRVLHDRTGGNPFYLGELLRLLNSEQPAALAGSGSTEAAASAVPAGVREVIDRRVARLPQDTQALLRAAAVGGRDIEVDVLESVMELDTERVLMLLEPAVASGLVEELPDGWDYRFSHALVRDALYVGLSRLQRARLHRRVGEALEAQPTASDRSAELAHHFGLAARVGSSEKAVEYAVKAARQAAGQRAHPEAVEFWELALAALDVATPMRRRDLLIELGRARRACSDTEGAREALDEAVQLALADGDEAAVIEAVTVFGGVTAWNWRPYGVVDDRMVQILRDRVDAEGLTDAQRAAMLGTLGVELYYGQARAEGEAYAARAVELARPLGDAALLAQTLNNYHIAAWVPERETERRRATDEAIALPGVPRPHELVARIHRMGMLMRAGDLPGFDADLSRARELVGEVNRPELDGIVRFAEASRTMLSGRYEEGERLSAEALDFHHRTSLWGGELPHLVQLFTSRRAQGRPGDAFEQLLEYAAKPAFEMLRPATILAAVESGDEGYARRLVGRWGVTIRNNWATDFVLVQWALVGAQLGTPDPEAVLADLMPYADWLATLGTTGACWGSTHHHIAVVLAALGRVDEARSHAGKALSAHRTLGFPVLTQRTEILLNQLTT